MPTAAKVVAAIGLAALAWFVSDLLKLLMPERSDFGWFNHVNALLGLIIGWRMIGARVGNNLIVAASNGLTATVVLVFTAVFSQAIYEMLRLSTRRVYRDPMKGFEDVFRLAADYGELLLNPTVLAILLIGGASVAVVAELVNSIWR